MTYDDVSLARNYSLIRERLTEASKKSLTAENAESAEVQGTARRAPAQRSPRTLR